MAGSQQYEFYDYSTPVYNYPEIGNEWMTNPLSGNYLAAFNTASVQAELHPPTAFTTSPYNAAYKAALLAYANAFYLP